MLIPQWLFLQRFAFPLMLSALCVVYLLLQTAMAFQDSPTLNEPAHLVSGLSHWKLGHYRIYRVNPPLVRMLAALPVLAMGYEFEWRNIEAFTDDRPEHWMGILFARLNEERILSLIFAARLACIPLGLIGLISCCLWSKALYGRSSAFIAGLLWCFSPFILGHGHLITNDVPAASFAALSGFTFWRWCQSTNHWTTLFTGVSLGVALLTKTTLIVLVPIYLMVVIMKLAHTTRRAKMLSHGLGLFCVAIYVLCAGYGFSDCFKPISSIPFESTAIRRARDSWGIGPISSILAHAGSRVPLPADYVLGMDLQQRDFESFGAPSYLRGEWSDRGWWWYYLYALFVKTPVAVLVMFVWRVANCLREPGFGAKRDAEGLLVAPAILILAVVSLNHGFCHHARYVIPALPYFFVLVSGISLWARSRRRKVVLAALVFFGVLGPLCTFPHCLAYFNEIVGGPKYGSRHLLHSSLDWGQGLLHLKRWQGTKGDGLPLHLAYYGTIHPRAAGIDFQSVPMDENLATVVDSRQAPRWYAVSANLLHGYPGSMVLPNGGFHVCRGDAFQHLRRQTPCQIVANSIYIFKIPLER